MRFLVVVAALMGFGSLSFGDNVRLLDIKKLKQNLGIMPEYNKIPGVEDVTYAIIDNGFEGLEKDDQNYLPSLEIIDFSKGYPNTARDSKARSVWVKGFPLDWLKNFPAIFTEGAEGKNESFATVTHGRTMAIVGTSLNTAKQILLPGLFPRTFCRSIQFAAELGVDAIVHSKIFEQYGSNDQTGPLEKCLEVATRKGIPIFNASGNYGKKVYNGAVRDAVGRYFDLHANFQSEVEITLSWNQWGTNFDTSGTDFDLDLILYQADPERPGNMVEIARSDLKQVNVPSDSLQEGQGRLPFEKIGDENYGGGKKVRLENGKDYKIRVKLKDPSTKIRSEDMLTLTVFGVTPPAKDDDTGKILDAIDFKDATSGEDTLFPAVSKQVITIGANYRLSARSRVNKKPDIVMPEYTAQMVNTDRSQGSSEANVILGAGVYPYLVAAARAVNRELTKEDLLSFTTTQRLYSTVARQADGKWTPAALPTNAERITDTMLLSRPGLKGMVDEVKRFGATGIKVWKVFNPQRYVVTIDQNPGELKGFEFVPPDGFTDDMYSAYEFYLGWRQKGVAVSRTPRSVYAREVIEAYRFHRARFDLPDVTNTTKRRDPYPWEDYGGNAIDYVEVRRNPVKIEKAEGQNMAVWKTPTLEELFTRLGVPNAKEKAAEYR